MNRRALIRSSLVVTAAVILAAPLAMQRGYTDDPCPLGTEPVINTGACASGPGGSIVRNKGGRLMNLNFCTTYRGREHDEVNYHSTTVADPTIQSAFYTGNDFDAGDIAVIQDDGSIIFTDQAGTRIDVVDVVRKFMATHQDVYDFVAIFPNFNHAEGSFHNHVKNDVQGINVPIQDNSAAFGTQFLKSLTLFRNFNNFPADPFARIPGNNDSTLSLIAQETGHRWAAWVRADQNLGTKKRPRATTFLLGRNEAHWCFYMNVPSVGPLGGFSSMEGNFWFESPPGTFTTVAQSDGYSELDQYLMGFRSQGQVAPFFRLDPGNGKPDPDCAHRPFTPVEDTPWVLTLPKINVTVDDITRVEGLRSPDAATSQKNWRMAFILLTQQGTLPTQAEIDKLDSYRVAWEAYFRDESVQGRMFTALGPVDMDGDTYFSNTDCDDNDPTVHPGATEACNFVDDDCDGLIDEDFDQDQDLYTTCNGDCNDADPLVNPGATEIWNGVDDNCDSVIDNVILIDEDGDGYYINPADSSQTDCDDTDPAVNPGAAELVNGIDDNCNGFIDCSDPTVVLETETGARGNDGFDNDCNGIIDG